MHDGDNDSPAVEVQAEKPADHVQGGLAGVMRIVSTALLSVTQGDATRLGGDEDDLSTPTQQTGMHETMHNENRCHRARDVRLQLVLPAGSLIGCEVFCPEEACGDDLAESAKDEKYAIPGRGIDSPPTRALRHRAACQQSSLLPSAS